MNEDFCGISNMLVRDLDWWNQVKCRTQKEKSNVLFKSGEMWWCRVGLNVGEEVFGKGLGFTRPILVFKKLTKNSFMGIPLTSQRKIGTWYVETTLNNTKRWVMLNQAKILDRKRLTNRIGTLDENSFKEVGRRFVEFYSS